MILLGIILQVLGLACVASLVGAWVLRVTRDPLSRSLATLSPGLVISFPIFLPSHPDALIFAAPRWLAWGGHLLAGLVLLWIGWNSYRLFVLHRAEQEIIKVARRVPGLSHAEEVGFNRMALEAGLQSPPSLLVHPSLSTPMILGVPPRILVPAANVPRRFLGDSSFWDALTPGHEATVEALRTILRHELAHVRRHDHLIRILQGMFFILLGPGLIAPDAFAFRRLHPWLGPGLRILRKLAYPLRRLLDVEREASEWAADGHQILDRPRWMTLGVLGLAVIPCLLAVPGYEAVKFAVTGRPILWSYLPLGWEVDGTPDTRIKYGVERLPHGGNKVIFNAVVHSDTGVVALTLPGGVPLKADGHTAWLAMSYRGQIPLVACMNRSEAKHTPRGTEYGALWKTALLKPKVESKGSNGWNYVLLEAEAVNAWPPGIAIGDRPMVLRKRELKIAFRGRGSYQIVVANPEEPHA